MEGETGDSSSRPWRVTATAIDVIQMQEGADEKDSNPTVKPIRKPEDKAAQVLQPKKGEYLSNQAKEGWEEKGFQGGGQVENKSPADVTLYIYILLSSFKLVPVRCVRSLSPSYRWWHRLAWLSRVSGGAAARVWAIWTWVCISCQMTVLWMEQVEGSFREVETKVYTKAWKTLKSVLRNSSAFSPRASRYQVSCCTLSGPVGVRKSTDCCFLLWGAWTRALKSLPCAPSCLASHSPFPFVDDLSCHTALRKPSSHVSQAMCFGLRS